MAATEVRVAPVGVIGPTKAGKTTFVAVLDQALTADRWSFEPVGDRELLDRIRARMTKGRWPDRTDRTLNEAVHLRISKGGLTLDLDFIDPAGEIFEWDRRQQREALDADREKVFEKLRDGSGLIILLDHRDPPKRLFAHWRASIEPFYAHIQANAPDRQKAAKLETRIAIVLTKADLLPWLRRHRERDAKAWMCGEGGLSELVSNVEESCNNARFFFSSAVGWDEGQPGARTAVVPHHLDLRLHFEKGETRDLIPDPPGSDGSSGAGTTLLPMFRDPLQLVTGDELREDAVRPEGVPTAPNPGPVSGAPAPTGVVMLPGRRRGTDGQRLVFTPWNVIEPLLWAAGFEPFDRGLG